MHLSIIQSLYVATSKPRDVVRERSNSTEQDARNQCGNQTSRPHSLSNLEFKTLSVVQIRTQAITPKMLKDEIVNSENPAHLREAANLIEVDVKSHLCEQKILEHIHLSIPQPPWPFHPQSKLNSISS